MKTSALDLANTNAIITCMSMDRTLCAICAWRGDCNKKFMQGNGVHCPDYTRDLTIRAATDERKEDKKPKDKKGTKKTREIRFL
jgi:hypothetical protein